MNILIKDPKIQDKKSRFRILEEVYKEETREHIILHYINVHVRAFTRK